MVVVEGTHRCRGGLLVCVYIVSGRCDGWVVNDYDVEEWAVRVMCSRFLGCM